MTMDNDQSTLTRGQRLLYLIDVLLLPPLTRRNSVLFILHRLPLLLLVGPSSVWYLRSRLFLCSTP